MESFVAGMLGVVSSIGKSSIVRTAKKMSKPTHWGYIWIRLKKPAHLVWRFPFFFFLGTHLGDKFHCYGYCSWTVSVIFDFSTLFSTLVGSVYYSWDPQTLLFSNFFIKNGSRDTIHIFKNYFAIMRSEERRVGKECW